MNNRLKLLILILFISQTLFSQDLINIKNNYNNYFNEYLKKNIHSLQVSPEIDKNSLVINKISELLNMGEYFKYQKQLLNGNYLVNINENIVSLIILKSGKHNKYLNANLLNKAVESNDILDVIKFNIIKTGKYIDMEMVDSNNNIEMKRLLENFEKKSGGDESSSSIDFIFRQRMIIDKKILSGYDPNVTGKILNRGFTRAKLTTINGNPCSMYSDVAAATIVTYDLMGQERARVISIDPIWDRIILFDRDHYYIPDPPVAFATAHPENSTYYTLNHPIDITQGTEVITINGGDTYVKTPIYISEMGTDRIIELIFLRHYFYNGHFDDVRTYLLDNSFRIIRDANIINPYGLALHKGTNSSINEDDKLWYSEGYYGNKSLVCIDPNQKNGPDIQRINSLNYGGRIINVNPGRISIYRSPDGQRNVLCFVDDVSNALVFLKLEPDGSYNSSSGVFGYLPFDDSHELKSVMLASNFNGFDGTTVWAVTDGGLGGCQGGQHCGYLSTLKINYVSNEPVSVDYLSTCWTALNSDKSFVHLQNLYTLSGYVDIFTIERWTDDFGIRRYKPGVGVIDESVSQHYCRNTGMNINLRLSNAVNSTIEAVHIKDGVETDLENIRVNGITYTAPLKLVSGNNSLSVWAPLPPGDDINDEAVRITFNLFPLDEYPPYSGNIVIKPFQRSVSDCGSSGCPYVYVHEGTEYVQDNNILHRSEFPENVGNDITDKYVLRVHPYFNEDTTDNTCLIKITETGEDYSYFDNFKLFAIDHPLGSNVGVTENNDVVIYFPDPVSPNYAENNGEDVTDSLQYFNNSIVEGEEGYETFALYSLGDKINQKLKRDVYRVISNAYDGYRKTLKMKKGKGESMPGDTVAIILNPHHPDNGVPIVHKDVAGVMNAFDKGSEYSSGDRQFARRQNPSDVIIPLDQNLNIDSLSINWNLEYALNYLAVSPFYYDGYIENELEFVEATKGDENIISQLLDIDGEYAEMDNSEDIILKFVKPEDSVQAGWERDYVLVTTGRYDASGGDGPPESDLVKGDNSIPKEYKLHQNYPNPFNPVTTIMYDIPKDGKVTIKIYDILGKEVYSLDEFRKAGYYRLDFNASHLASGVYFYTIKSNEFYKAKKMLMIK